MKKTNLIVFIGIVILGALLSFFFLNRNVDTVEVVEGETPEQKVAEPADPEPAPKTEPTTEKKQPSAPEKTTSAPETPEKKAAPVAAVDSPEKLMSQLSNALSRKDYDGFKSGLAPDAIAPSLEPRVKALVTSPDLSLSKDKPYTEISKSADSLRWAFNFVPDEPREPVKPSTPLDGSSVASTAKGDMIELQEMYADLKKLDTGGYGVTQISFPIAVELSSEAESAPAAASPGAPATASVADAEVAKPDSLTVAHAFSRAVVARDFKTARALSDPASVTDERVAALMIAIEEGKFALREDRPLVVTLSREDITWVLTRVQSGSSASEFALELGQIDESWKVNGLTFSKVLSALSDQAGGGEIAYSPIVEDPAGGDSLVLYFEFDEAELTPRATRQLAIVADILSQGEDRVMRINGHADALGSDAYNSKLSNGRADSIRRALISMGVKPDQVVTEAYGETQPRRPNFNADGSDNPSGRSQNRRAEVFLDF